MVACFISEVEQDLLLDAEDRQQGMEIPPTGYISERHKSLYPCMAVIHNTAYMLSGEKRTSRLKYPANFPTPSHVSHAWNQDISHGTTLVRSVGTDIPDMRDLTTLQARPYNFINWDVLADDYAHVRWDPLISAYMMEKYL
jgi:hypothetical protein